MRIAAMALAVTYAASAARAQSRPRPTDLVRVTTTAGSVIEGKVHRSARDSLLLGDTLRGFTTIRRPDIASYSSYDRQRMAGVKRGARIGALIGLAPIAAGLYVDLTHCRKPGSECMGFMTPIGVAVALDITAIGGAIGFLTAPQRWSGPRQYRR